MDEKGLGRLLADARRAAGLTQQELCQQSGLSYSTLAKIERGAIKSPSIFTVQQVAEALGSSIDTLLGFEVGAGQKTAEKPKKRSKSGIEFVYFDVHGCVVRFFQGAFAAAAKGTGSSSDVIETIFWHYNDAVCRGEMSLAELDRAFATQLHQPRFDWTKYHLEAISAIPETADLLVWVSQYYRMGLLTNIMPGYIQIMRERGLLPKVPYDAIIDSSEVGAIKPEPRIYELAAEKVRVKPGAILLVDDSRANLMAAERLGWRVLWFDDYRPEESIQRIKQALEF